VSNVIGNEIHLTYVHARVRARNNELLCFKLKENTDPSQIIENNPNSVRC
jgi:hypothetical protein